MIDDATLQWMVRKFEEDDALYPEVSDDLAP
jgi:hypothetical protein